WRCPANRSRENAQSLPSSYLQDARKQRMKPKQSRSLANGRNPVKRDFPCDKSRRGLNSESLVHGDPLPLAVLILLKGGQTKRESLLLPWFVLSPSPNRDQPFPRASNGCDSVLQHGVVG